jgi:HEAT repeat protein
MKKLLFPLLITFTLTLLLNNALFASTQQTISKAKEAGNKKSVPLLIYVLNALKDKNPYVRATAAKVLGEIGDKTAVPALIKALKDENPDVRTAAAEALGKIGDKRAVPHLIKALKDKYFYVRTAAAKAIFMLIKDERVIPILKRILEGKEKPSALKPYLKF